MKDVGVQSELGRWVECEDVGVQSELGKVDGVWGAWRMWERYTVSWGRWVHQIVLVWGTRKESLVHAVCVGTKFSW